MTGTTTPSGTTGKDRESVPWLSIHESGGPWNSLVSGASTALALSNELRRGRATSAKAVSSRAASASTEPASNSVPSADFSPSFTTWVRFVAPSPTLSWAEVAAGQHRRASQSTTTTTHREAAFVPNG